LAPGAHPDDRQLDQPRAAILAVLARDKRSVVGVVIEVCACMGHQITGGGI
jgi:hypothetical protein